MNFGFTEEQELLRAEVRKFLDEKAPLEEVRKIVESSEGISKALWEQMGELGWIGLAVPEQYGGAGLDLVTLVPLLEESGRSLFPSPLVSTVLAAKAIERLGSQAQKERWLPGLADGSRVGTLAIVEESDLLAPEGIAMAASAEGDAFRLDGEKRFVPDAAQADLFVVAFRSRDGEEGIGLAVLERSATGLSTIDYPSMDATKRTGALVLEGVRVEGDALLGGAAGQWSAISWLLELGAALTTAEAAGSAEQAIAITTEFAKERVQFGSPIGRFQGVKHPLADMYVDVQSFQSLAYYAAWALDQGRDDASQAVARAKAYASEVFPEIGIRCVELHGGVGYTWEYDIQLYLKRAKWVRAAFGDADHHYERLAEAAGL